jgi:EmrB/QacA subfamily drug resistance transporter
MQNSFPSESQISQNKKSSGRPVLISTMLANLAVAFMTSSINVSLPVMNREFQTNAVLLTWCVTAYTLAIAAFSVPFGSIADLIGRKRVFLSGVLIFTVTSAVAIFSQSVFMLIACRCIQGISAAMMQGMSIAMLTASYPASQRGRVLGLSVATVFIGQSIGPFCGGLLAEHVGWRSIFGVGVSVGITVFFITILRVKTEWVEARGSKFDRLGAAIYCLALVALIYGFSQLPGISGIVIGSIGLIGMLFFLKWESIVQSPMLDLKLFRHNRVFVLSNVSTLIIFCTCYAVLFLLSLYLQYVKGFTSEIAGFILLAMPAMQAILAPVAGRLSDHVDPRIVSSIGMALVFLGAFAFVFLNNATPVAVTAAVLVDIGIGLALFASPNSNTVMSSVAPQQYAVAAAVANTTRTLGNTLSLSITMIVFALIIGNVTLTAEYASSLLASLRIIFGIFSAMCLVGIFTSLTGVARIRNIAGNPWR